MQKQKTSMVGMFVLAILVVGMGIWNLRLVQKPVDPNSPEAQAAAQPEATPEKVDQAAESKSMREALGTRGSKSEAPVSRRDAPESATPPKVGDNPKESMIKQDKPAVATKPKVDANRTGSQWYADDAALNGD